MRSHLFIELGELVASFAKRPDGAIAPTFALALIPIMVGVGAAIDYSHANSFKVALQAALDSAVLSGAKDGTSSWTNIALNVFNANLSSKFGSAPTPTFVLDSASGTYTGSVTGSQPTAVLGIIKISSISVTVKAAAAASAPDNSCILTFDHGQSASHVSLTLNGAPIVNLSGCTLRSNTSISCNGHDGNVTQSIAAGSATSCGHPQSSAPKVPDIYASLAANITKNCGSSRPGVSWVPGTLPTGSGFITVNKGSYIEYHICGDLNLSGIGYLTGIAPSSDTIIVIENGNLNIANDAVINTMKTAVVLTGNNNFSSQINFPNGAAKQATLTLSPPIDAANPWQGVALYQDPSLTKNIDDSWGPGAAFNADGLVYLGNANVVTDGNTASSNAKCSKFVMNTFTTNGHVDLDFDQSVTACSNIGLKQWSGVVVHLVQ